MARKHVVAGLVAAGALGLGLAAPAVAFAGDTDPAPRPSASQDKASERKQAFAEALAEKLGVPADKVATALEELREEHAADRPHRGDWRTGDWRTGDRPGGDRPGGDATDRQAALKERLARAVEDGKLTQEQADAITAAVEAGVFPGGHPGARPGR
ncbi:hypothetical protein O7606_00365 [Micromonospora sp. WMMD882]|uniref:hypothetical protein n=1 Tax=Micromonospora sp. WMMD882 TaxID=3015151 RepID=UPI00248CF497|nr:hypothetical protein [Micromonospora sp. WMMD882]WBB79904.1 hypothetical protein O7606_00365 [Micromonospora sp. WMMD882]